MEKLYIDKHYLSPKLDSIEDRLKRFDILQSEANTVRENDKALIKSMFRNFYNRNLNVGIGFQRAYGSILSGDYFDLIKLPDGNYLFVFADISGHGLPAYTTLVRLRSAITMAVKEAEMVFRNSDVVNTTLLVRDICSKFTDIMDESNSDDFACVNFTFISNINDRFRLRFYNRSMLFPIIIRKNPGSAVEIISLNHGENGWVPRTGMILGSNIRRLTGEGYLDTPQCEYMLGECDSVLFFSDGITEAYNPDIEKDAHGTPAGEDFGERKLMGIIGENIALEPQEIINRVFDTVYEYIGHPGHQKDDMTAVLIDFPSSGE